MPDLRLSTSDAGEVVDDEARDLWRELVNTFFGQKAAAARAKEARAKRVQAKGKAKGKAKARGKAGATGV
eukprot:121821-Lingulodinium_polyedra.AAC.1